MYLLNILFVLYSVTSVLSKPYEYSYYISLPGHYQSLAVKDGAVSINNSPPLGANPGPGFRRGRLNPAFNPNPGYDRRFPVTPGSQMDPNFEQRDLNPGFSQNPELGRRFPVTPGNQANPSLGGLNPGFNQNPGVDGRFPVIPGNNIGPDYRQGGLNPGFNQYPEFGRRNPDQNVPDFRRGRDDPDNEDIPDGEVDLQFSQGGRFPGSQNRPDFRNGIYNPSSMSNGELNPVFNRGGSISPEFGTRIQPLIPRRRDLSQRTPSPEEKEGSASTDREEVTTPQPCSFCGVNKINPMDGIDGNNINPDSEPIEPKNVGGTADPGFVIQNNVGTPAGVSVPGYLFNNPYVTYYVVSSL